MNKVERVQALFKNHKADRCGFWTGNPSEEALKIYCDKLGIDTGYVSIAEAMQDDFIWLNGERAWSPKDNHPLFDVYGGKPQVSLSQPGIFAECEDTKEIDNYDWSDPNDFDFSILEKEIDDARAKGFAVMSGLWSPFFHLVDAFFGMENYYIKMYTNPDVVDAVTTHVVDIYLEANKKCFELLGDKIDCFFFGNDLGSQRDLLISPDMFDRFVLPSIKRLVDCAKSYGKHVMLHSCGSIAKVIPSLIDAGIDALHPLQAKARGMDAASLAQYKNDLVFVGGVDTQDLLPFKSAKEVRDEVYRIKDILGDGLIVSPSHEALLPNVPIENAIAMRDAALE
jgi:uroporphyrinogen decarboxylase